MIKFENKSNGRYYYLIVERDMLDHLILTVIRGGLFGRRVRHMGYNCPYRIKKEIAKITAVRLKRGYQLIQN